MVKPLEQFVYKPKLVIIIIIITIIIIFEGQAYEFKNSNPEYLWGLWFFTLNKHFAWYFTDFYRNKL